MINFAVWPDLAVVGIAAALQGKAKACVPSRVALYCLADTGQPISERLHPGFHQSDHSELAVQHQLPTAHDVLRCLAVPLWQTSPGQSGLSMPASTAAPRSDAIETSGAAYKCSPTSALLSFTICQIWWAPKQDSETPQNELCECRMLTVAQQHMAA